MRRGRDCRASKSRAAPSSEIGCCPDRWENRRRHCADEETTRVLDPKGDARAKPCEERERPQTSEHSHRCEYGPGILCSRLSEQRTAQHIDGGEQGVELCPPGIGTQRTNWPHDGG